MFDPLNVMEGAVGGVQPFAETLTAFEVALQPFEPVMVTRYDPWVVIVTLRVAEPFDQL